MKNLTNFCKLLHPSHGFIYWVILNNKLLFSAERIRLMPFYYVQDVYQKNQLRTRLDERLLLDLNVAEKIIVQDYKCIKYWCGWKNKYTMLELRVKQVTHESKIWWQHKETTAEENQPGILKYYVFCRKIQQGSSGLGDNTAGALYLSMKYTLTVASSHP